MAQDTPKETANADQHAETANAERQERLSQLILRRSKLSADEAALRREVFPAIRASHRELVWNFLRKQRLVSHNLEELHQEAFLALHKHILKHGFPDSLPAMLTTLTAYSAQPGH